MIELDDFGEPGGVAVVSCWIDDLYDHAPTRRLWTSLDDRLRLALAQGWILGTHCEPNDDLAEDLAADDTDNKLFTEMFSFLIEHWRSVYRILRDGSGLLNQVNLVGANLELVVLTSPEQIGYVPAGTAILAHSFITRLEADDWVIAALARRLPVPRWPPTEEVISGLGIDG